MTDYPEILKEDDERRRIKRIEKIIPDEEGIDEKKRMKTNCTGIIRTFPYPYQEIGVLETKCQLLLMT